MDNDKTKQEVKFSELLTEAITKPGVLSSCYSNFHGYSLGNKLIALFECMHRGINPGPIATFKRWQELGRCVKKGEKAISLCVPRTYKSEKEKSDGSIEESCFTRFIFVPRFFVLSQTDGADLPPIKGDSWDLESALPKLEIEWITYTDLCGNSQGYAMKRCVAINPIAVLPHKTIAHEIAHILLGHTAENLMTDSETTPRDLREVEAESVAYIVISVLGLPGQEESRGYIQHWARSGQIPEKSARKIMSVADKILEAARIDS